MDPAAAAGGSGAGLTHVDSVDVEVAEWSATTAYDAGDQVAYAGSLWQAGWWTRGQAPGDPNGTWQELRTSPGGEVIWTPSRAFNYGDVALYEGLSYFAKWHTRNQLPSDPNGPWRLQSSQGSHQPGSPTDWSVAADYDTGALVRHGGHLWRATWWAGHQEPGQLDGPWGEIAFSPDGSVVWTPTRVFNGGDEVVFQGAEYVAKWWTRNQTPGDPNGPWRLTSTEAGGTLTWTADAVFDPGDVVVHDAARYVATQANRAAEPGDATGPWAAIPEAVTVTAPPKIVGVAAVGRAVRARTGQWADPAMTFTYRWFIGAKPLKRGTSRAYAIAASLRGTKLRVVVTAHRQGSTVGSAGSKAVKVLPRGHQAGSADS